MKHLRDPHLIAANFSSAIGPARANLLIVTNDTQIAALLRNKIPSAQVLPEDARGLAGLVSASEFIGTYRSKLSVHVNTMRARRGSLVNTDTGDLLEMGNSQAGTLSPYMQDVEDVEFTVNERLRGCKDNIDDLRDVLRTFVL
jgi:hypothetical protein